MTTREEAKAQCNKAMFNALTGGSMAYKVEHSEFDVDNVVKRTMDVRVDSESQQQTWARMWTIFDEEWRRYELLPRVHP